MVSETLSDALLRSIGADTSSHPDLYRTMARELLARRSKAETGPSEGWKLVPVEPTQDMCNAGYSVEPDDGRYDNYRERNRLVMRPKWQAMIAAAPPLPTPEGKQS